MRLRTAVLSVRLVLCLNSHLNVILSQSPLFLILTLLNRNICVQVTVKENEKRRTMRHQMSATNKDSFSDKLRKGRKLQYFELNTISPFCFAFGFFKQQREKDVLSVGYDIKNLAPHQPHHCQRCCRTSSVKSKFLTIFHHLEIT